MEFELERDTINPLNTIPTSGLASSRGLDDESTSQLPGNTICRDPASQASQVETEWIPNVEDILESTTSYAKPLPTLERLRRGLRIGPTGLRHSYHEAGNIGGMGIMDTFAIMGQINEQFDAAPDLDMLLKVVVAIIKDLTQFHRVLVYQFDEAWNGKVVAELVDQSQANDIYRGLHFPASDIPAQVSKYTSDSSVHDEMQARQLYALSTPFGRKLKVTTSRPKQIRSGYFTIALNQLHVSLSKIKMTFTPHWYVSWLSWSFHADICVNTEHDTLLPSGYEPDPPQM